MMKPDRSCSNIRVYSKENLKYLLNVSILYDNGLKISNIAKLSLDELSAEVRSLSSKSIPHTSQIRNLVMAMIEIDEDRFEKLVNSNILSFGLEETMTHVLFPFLQHVGILWITNSINPAQEHFITHLIRQKLIAAIDGLGNQLKAGYKKFILYLPEGELHEIGLLFAFFLIKARGHKVIYLGQSLPIADLAEIQKTQIADVIMTFITASPSQNQMAAYVKNLKEILPDTKIWLSGYQITSQKLECPSGFSFIYDISSLKNMLD